MNISTSRLSIQGVNYFWQGKPQSSAVLDSLSFEINSGEFTALLGPNGSGKSTLLKLISGVITLNRPRCSGQLFYQDLNLLKISSEARARLISYVPLENIPEFPITVEESVSLGRICHGGRGGREEVHRAMKLCHCFELRSRYVHSLSVGERQLVSLARAIAQGSKILLLDESLSNMDINHQFLIGKMLQDLVQRSGYSVVLVSHDLNLATEWANSVLFLKAGRKIAHGKINEVLNLDLMRTIYSETPLLLVDSPVSGKPKIYFGK